MRGVSAGLDSDLNHVLVQHYACEHPDHGDQNADH